MKTIFKILNFGFFLGSVLIYSQNSFEKIISDNLKFNSESISSNGVDKVTLFSGNVSLVSEKLSFDSAEKVIFDTKNQKIEIFNPKNLKANNLQPILQKDTSKNANPIIYYIKDSYLEI